MTASTLTNKADIQKIKGMLAITQFRIFCLPGCYEKTKNQRLKTIILPGVLYGHKTQTGWTCSMHVVNEKSVYNFC